MDDGDVAAVVDFEASIPQFETVDLAESRESQSLVAWRGVSGVLSAIKCRKHP